MQTRLCMRGTPPAHTTERSRGRRQHAAPGLMIAPQVAPNMLSKVISRTLQGGRGREPEKGAIAVDRHGAPRLDEPARHHVHQRLCWHAAQLEDGAPRRRGDLRRRPVLKRQMAEQRV